MFCKVWDESTFQMVSPLKFGMDKFFHHTLYNGCSYLFMVGLKLHHVFDIEQCSQQVNHWSLRVAKVILKNVFFNLNLRIDIGSTTGKIGLRRMPQNPINK